MTLAVTEHIVRTDRHTSFYLACGPADGTPIIFVHGWPELSLSWRHQLACLGNLGFRAMAPDMRGYGRATPKTAHPRSALPNTVPPISPPPPTPRPVPPRSALLTLASPPPHD